MQTGIFYYQNHMQKIKILNKKNYDLILLVYICYLDTNIPIILGQCCI